MAKNMAILIGNEVANIAVFSDLEQETEAIKNCGGYSVRIGDKYANGRFYHDGKLIQTDAEIAAELEEKLKEAEYAQDDNGNIYHKEIGTDGEIHLVLIESYTGELFQ